MELTKEQQKMLDGEQGEAVRQSMEILLALGKIYGAKNLIPVTSAQIAGVSYKTIGNAGLEYLQDMVKKGAKVRIPSSLNPPGMDVEQWKEMHIPAPFAKKQIQILDAYASMGIRNACTCTPYLVGVVPKKGEHVSWSESSAVAYANSVLGARTNREGGPSALAAAICGVTPNYGFHLDGNRVAQAIIDVECDLHSETDFGAMGYYIGEIVKDKNPAFRGKGVRHTNVEKLKGLGAAMAASGSVGLFMIEGKTPEWKVADDAERISFGVKELAEVKEKIGALFKDKPQLITIGCPHASLDEIRHVVEIIERKQITKLESQLWVCTARDTKKKAAALGYVEKIEMAGGRVVADTCMVVCPLEQMGFTVTGCNSGKAAKYLPSLCKQKTVFGDMEDLIN